MDTVAKLATLSETSTWATEMEIVSSPSGEERVQICRRRSNGEIGQNIVLSLEELKNMITAYIEWEEEGGCLKKVPVKTGPSLPKLNILQKIAVLGKTSDEWNKELNICSFNEKEPKFDIREWLPDYSMRRNGQTLTEAEMEVAAHTYEQHFGPLPHKKEHWWE